jgi:energy-coupling factor transport system substrate-specific component
MSWQLASFALVLAALALAFWWYERSQPPTRMIALVATLAALAALGRDAFAAIPDVKPITAIVLVGGVAFGAGPGFAIGAISGVASNILLGEGPWTPWQMLGWGLVGLIGAALGRLTRRQMGALALALACAASAEAFNLLLDVYVWTGTGSHTLAGFGAVLGTAVVFDVTHVVASFAFGLAFGPALLRMLRRVRARTEVEWAPPAARVAKAPGASQAALALILALGLLGASATYVRASTGGGPAQASRLAVSREISFLTAAQNTDGGFGAARGQASSELYSAWVAIGLAAAGVDPLSVRRGGHTVLDALRAQASSLQGSGDLERTILALHACGASVRSLAGGDPVLRLLRARRPDGSFERLANITAFAIFALRAAGYPASAPVIRGAARWLISQQDSDGGFGFATRGGGSDVDDTAAAVQALVAAGVHGGRGLSRARAFLTRAQSLDGGYPQQPGGLSNAQSSAWAVQAIVALGGDPTRLRRAGSRSPVAYLESLLAPDGSVRYSRTGSQTPVWVTAQALTALAQKPFPIAPPAHAAAAREASAGASGALARRGNARSAARAFVAARPAKLSTQAPPTATASFARTLSAILERLLAPMSW